MALFRVKLHCKKIVSGQRRIGAHPVLHTAGQQLALDGMHIKTMHKIKPGVIFYIRPEWVLTYLLYLIPPHMWNLQPRTIGGV